MVLSNDAAAGGSEPIAVAVVPAPGAEVPIDAREAARILWRQAQAKAKAAAAKPLPPVQRPGASQSKGATREEVIQSLTKNLDASGSLKDAAALLRARRTRL
jgi:hypothetical protein